MLIKFDNVNFSYNNNIVFNNLDLEINRGSIYGVIGDNGCGKTTFFKLSLGILLPSNGNIDTEFKRPGYLPEDKGINLNDNIYNHIRYIAIIKGMNRKSLELVINEWLDFFDLILLKNIKIKHLSKGNRQKIRIITCFINSPDFIVLDEPFDGLDYKNKTLLIELINKVKSEGCTVLISSHQSLDLEHICSDFLIFKSDQTLTHISKEKLRSQNSSFEIVIENYDDELYDKLSIEKYINYHQKKETDYHIFLEEMNIKHVLNILKNENVNRIQIIKH